MIQLKGKSTFQGVGQNAPLPPPNKNLTVGYHLAQNMYEYCQLHSNTLQKRKFLEQVCQVGI